MNLTGKQLVEEGIITGPIEECNIQQHGVDLNLVSVALIDGKYDESGIVRAGKGKTELAKRYIVPLNQDHDGHYWYLKPGAYEILLAQGCVVPNDKKLLIRQRSSLLRNGTILHSSVFDAGFHTDKIGTVMIVMVPIRIYHNARVAQIYSSNSNVVENLYDGQWQSDKQRG